MKIENGTTVIIVNQDSCFLGRIGKVIAFDQEFSESLEYTVEFDDGGSTCFSRDEIIEAK